MCFGTTLSYLHKEFINSLPPRSKFNLHPPRTRPVNADTRIPRRLTRPAQDSSSLRFEPGWKNVHEGGPLANTQKKC